MRAYVDLEKVLPKSQYYVLLDLMAYPKSKNRVRSERLKMSHPTFCGRLKELVKKGLAVKLCYGIYTYIHHAESLKPVRTFRVMDSKVNYCKLD